RWLLWPTVVSSVLTTCYTGFLFAQGLARDLWQGPHATIDLLAQAIAEGAAVLLLVAVVPIVGDLELITPLAAVLVGAMVVHLLFITFETLLAPSPTKHHDLAVRAIRRGAFARVFWGCAIGVAAGSVIVGVIWSHLAPAIALAALLALVGSFAWEYVWVEAGQSVPLS